MTITPLIEVPGEEDLGEAMLACTPAERAWVIAKVQLGCTNGKAAELAGFSASSPDVLKSAGYAVAHKERAQEAIIEETRKVLKTHGPKAVRTLAKIMGDPTAENKDRIKASVELLNRANLSAVTEAHVTVNHQLSDSEYDRRLQSALQVLGIDAPPEQLRKALIDPANIIEAEWEPAPLSDDPVNIRNRARHAAIKDLSPEERKARTVQIQAERSAALKAKRAEAEAYRTFVAENTDDDLTDLF